MGLIDHGHSQATQTIQYRQNWSTALTVNGQYGPFGFFY